MNSYFGEKNLVFLAAAWKPLGSGGVTRLEQNGASICDSRLAQTILKAASNALDI